MTIPPDKMDPYKMNPEEPTTTRGRIFEFLSRLTKLVLFIIGCIGAAGILPGSTVGWLAIGLGGGAFALSLAAGELKNRKITLLTGALAALIPIVLGSLGVTGILSGVQVGWGTLVPLLPSLALVCCGICCATCLCCLSPKNLEGT